MPVIATNTAANSSLFYLNRNSALQSQSLSKISSGSRIVRSSDDAAGLAVADQLQSDITSLTTAAQTTQQVAAMLQIADGGLARTGEILQRMKALATQWNSGTVDATSQGFIEAEYDLLVAEIDLIATTTVYNGQNLIDGTFNLDAVVGVASAQVISIDLSTVDADQAGLGIPAAGAFGAIGDVDTIDTAIGTLGGYRATVGSLTSAFEFQGEVIATQLENLAAAKSSISDVDLAAEQTAFTNYQVLTEAAIAGLAQANQMKTSLLSLVR